MTSYSISYTISIQYLIFLPQYLLYTHVPAYYHFCSSSQPHDTPWCTSTMFYSFSPKENYSEVASNFSCHKRKHTDAWPYMDLNKNFLWYRCLWAEPLVYLRCTYLSYLNSTKPLSRMTASICTPTRRALQHYAAIHICNYPAFCSDLIDKVVIHCCFSLNFFNLWIFRFLLR